MRTVYRDGVVQPNRKLYDSHADIVVDSGNPRVGKYAQTQGAQSIIYITRAPPCVRARCRAHSRLPVQAEVIAGPKRSERNANESVTINPTFSLYFLCLSERREMTDTTTEHTRIMGEKYHRRVGNARGWRMKATKNSKWTPWFGEWKKKRANKNPDVYNHTVVSSWYSE